MNTVEDYIKQFHIGCPDDEHHAEVYVERDLLREENNRLRVALITISACPLPSVNRVAKKALEDL